MAFVGYRAVAPRTLAAAILVAGFAGTLAVNLPGHLEFDSIRQLLEGQRGAYSNWHPPVMSWLLGVSDALSPKASLFVAFDAALGFGAILSLLWIVPRPAWTAVAAAAIGVALPQLFLFEAIVWKDILFADACLAGFVCLAHAAAQWHAPRLRFALLGAAVLFVALAVLTRQNGVLVLPCATLATGAIAAQAGRWRQGLYHGAGFLVVAGLVVFAINAGLQTRATAAMGSVEQIEDLQIYDIAGMLVRQPQLALPILDRERPELARALRARSGPLYTPAAHDQLTDDPSIVAQITASTAAVSRQWRALVLTNTASYLAVRATVFSWLFWSRHPNECPIYTVGIDGDANDIKATGLQARFDRRDILLRSLYADPLIGTPAFSHPVFAALGLLCLVGLLIRRRPADLAMAGLLLATILYTASYFVISIACEYRYLYVIDLATIAALFYLAVDPPFRRRRAPAPPV